MVTEKYTFSVFPLHKSKGPNLIYHKIGQGQPRDFIYTIFKELTPKMLHTKIQGNRLSGSGEEDFLKVLPYMDMAAILVI